MRAMARLLLCALAVLVAGRQQAQSAGAHGHPHKLAVALDAGGGFLHHALGPEPPLSSERADRAELPSQEVEVSSSHSVLQAGVKTSSLAVDLPIIFSALAVVGVVLGLQVEYDVIQIGKRWTTEVATVTGLADGVTYFAFMLTGCSCGWFCSDSVWQLVTNQPEIQLDGRMFGRLSIVVGAVGCVITAIYFVGLGVFAWRPSARAEQIAVITLSAVTTVSLAVIGSAWFVDPPNYPVVPIGCGMGVVVACSTYFLILPHVATYYGGWLVAPLRAGTDLSTLITTVVAEAQNPTGNKNLFPTWILFTFYTTLAAFGLGAWLVIAFFGIGRREGIELEQSDVSPTSGEPKSMMRKLRENLETFYCDPKYYTPIAQASVAGIIQWGLLAPIANVGARMCAPACTGPVEEWVYRTSLTVNRVFVPAGSIASSYARCPRWLYNVLFGVSCLSGIGMMMATFGWLRSFWITFPGQITFIACLGLIGGTEGYLLTMCFRYIGDDEDTPFPLRQSSSRALSLSSLMTCFPVSLLAGILVNANIIACRPP